jgi:hypothetical protein
LVLGGCGIQTAGLAFGGNGPSNSTEEYDGSTWTAGGNLGTARYSLMGCGTQTAALAFGGTVSGSAVSNTEEYDGSAWSNTTSMTTARDLGGGAGTQTAGLAFGGYTAIAATEEYSPSFLATKTITTSTS